MILLSGLLEEIIGKIEVVIFLRVGLLGVRVIVFDLLFGGLVLLLLFILKGILNWKLILVFEILLM